MKRAVCLWIVCVSIPFLAASRTPGTVVTDLSSEEHADVIRCVETIFRAVPSIGPYITSVRTYERPEKILDFDLSTQELSTHTVTLTGVSVTYKRSINTYKETIAELTKALNTTVCTERAGVRMMIAVKVIHAPSENKERDGTQGENTIGVMPLRVLILDMRTPA